VALCLTGLDDVFGDTDNWAEACAGSSTASVVAPRS